MKKNFVFLLILVMAITLFTACGNKEAESNADVNAVESVSDDGEMTDSVETEESTEEEESMEDETVAQPTPTTKEINQTITDTELGYTITLKQAIVDLPFDDPNIWYEGYRTGVCVEVEMKNDSEYTGGLYASSLKLLVDGTPASNTNFFKNYADENNLSEISLNGAQSGESISGWMFFCFETGSGYDEMVFRYSRDETIITVIGGPDGGTNSTLPAQDFDIAF